MYFLLEIFEELTGLPCLDSWQPEDQNSFTTRKLGHPSTLPSLLTLSPINFRTLEHGTPVHSTSQA